MKPVQSRAVVATATLTSGVVIWAIAIVVLEVVGLMFALGNQGLNPLDELKAVFAILVTGFVAAQATHVLVVHYLARALNAGGIFAFVIAYACAAVIAIARGALLTISMTEKNSLPILVFASGFIFTCLATFPILHIAASSIWRLVTPPKYVTLVRFVLYVAVTGILTTVAALFGYALSPLVG